MTVLSITCDNCGAKYKLPESFSGAQAKCQKCGSVIDVARQRAAAAGPATASPAAAARPAAAPKPAAAARPAIDRSKEAPKPVERASAPAASAARTERPRRGTAGGDGDGDTGAGGRRGRERPAKKSNAMPLLLSGVGLVAIVVVVLVFVMGRGDKPAETPKQDTTAKADTPAAPAANAASDPAASDKPATDKPPAAAPGGEKPAVPAAPAKPAGAADPAATAPAPDKGASPATEAPKPAEGAPPAAAPTDASATPAADDPTRVKRPWEKMSNPPASMDQVADPKSYGPIPWPASVDDPRKAELRALATEAAGDGMPAVRAKNKLKEIGYAAMFAVVEQLQKLDYKDATQSMVAADLNKLMEDITGGLNARFEFVDATETIPPAKAEWNTRSVKGWIGELAKMQDEEKFKKDRVARVKKQAAADK